MREIKFRAWDKLNKEFIADYNTGDYIPVDIYADGSFQVRRLDLVDELLPTGHNQYDRLDIIFQDRAILMQFTGLKDKNGTEIYEGDIVSMHQFLFDGVEFEREHIGVIEWITADEWPSGGIAAYGVRITSGNCTDELAAHVGGGEFTTPMNVFHGLHDESFEVIGNIYENPELIKAEEVA